MSVATTSLERVRVLIVDDEAIARDTLKTLLSGDAEVEVIGECGDGRAAARIIAEDRPDLVFLDVQMPELDGFAVLEALGEELPAVVFVTAYDRYALRAFDVHAIDYLLKPFDDERFRVALGRAKAAVRQGEVKTLSKKLVSLLKKVGLERAAEASSQPSGAAGALPGRRATDAGTQGRDGSRYFERLAIKIGTRVLFLRADEIDWVEASDDHVRLHVGQRSYLLRETMQSLEKRLNPTRFVRIHRSTIVHLGRVKELQRQFHGDYVVVLTDGTELRLSRGYRAALEGRIGRPL